MHLAFLSLCIMTFQEKHNFFSQTCKIRRRLQYLVLLEFTETRLLLETFRVEVGCASCTG